jgi:hypothetical protein
MHEKTKWENLSHDAQYVYLRKAKYLVQYNYISGEIAELAKQMYEKDKQ